MIFQKRTDFMPGVTGLALGGTAQFPITRDFHIESMWIAVTFTVGTSMSTANADAIQNIIQRVQLNISDGARTRNVVDVSGAGLLEYAVQTLGSLDRNTASAIGTNTTGAKTLYYPLFCSHPQIEDPTGSLFLLPAPRFNANPTLTVQLSTQAQMDTNATPTFALTGTATVRLIINRRQVNRANWPTLDWELAEQAVAYAATGNSQIFELPIPGSYTGIMLRDYTSSSARGTIQTSGGENKLSLLGTVIRRFDFTDLQMENDATVNLYPATWNNMSGTAFLDFLTDKRGESGGDLGSALDANILAASGARLQLVQDITGGATAQRKYLFHRVFGNLNPLKFGGKAK